MKMENENQNINNNNKIENLKLYLTLFFLLFSIIDGRSFNISFMVIIT